MTTYPSKVMGKLRVVSQGKGSRALRLCGQLVFWNEAHVQHPPVGEVDIRRAMFLRVNENRETTRVFVYGYRSIEVPRDFVKPMARRYYLKHKYLPAYLFRGFLPDDIPAPVRLP